MFDLRSSAADPHDVIARLNIACQRWETLAKKSSHRILKECSLPLVQISCHRNSAAQREMCDCGNLSLNRRICVRHESESTGSSGSVVSPHRDRLCCVLFSCDGPTPDCPAPVFNTQEVQLMMN